MTRNALDLHVETFGPAGGTPLVLVHGGAGSIESHWAAAIPQLSRNRPVIAIDLQGHGRSPHSDRPYTFDNSADDIADVVTRSSHRQVDIMGFSNGGPTALRFAGRHGGLCRRVVAASGFVNRRGMVEGFWDDMFTEPSVQSMPAVLADAYRRINPDPDDLQRMFDLDVSLMVGFEDWAEGELESLALPVLFVSGDRDVVVPQHTLDMAARAPLGRALVLPAGHGDYLGTTDTGDVDWALTTATLSLICRFLDE